jgi:hypothetical protein
LGSTPRVHASANPVVSMKCSKAARVTTDPALTSYARASWFGVGRAAAVGSGW